MSRKPPSGRSGKAEAAGQSKRIVPPPPAGPPVMPRPFDASDLQDLPVDVDIVATPAECEALAASFGIPAVARLSSRLQLRKQARIVTVTGRMTARVTQTCVVTLEPFDSDITDDIEVSYAPESIVVEAWAQIAREEAAGHATPADDPPDVIVDGRIDLGALTAESLALALDPYPKKPGVEFEPPAAGEAAADESPFAVLSRLRERDGGGGRDED